jgi:putative acetyltransferase
MKILAAGKQNYSELIQIWESSVRATHHFLTENDIRTLRPLILEEYFKAVKLVCAKNSNDEIIGFCGISGNKLEMLFISPDYMRQGVGSSLCRHAIQVFGVTMVDVNEQNEKAIKFYKTIGFRIIGKSQFDGQGMPFPLLHMTLSQQS